MLYYESKLYSLIFIYKISKQKFNNKEGIKMLSNVKSMSLHGLDGYLIETQVDVSSRYARLGMRGTSRC